MELSNPFSTCHAEIITIMHDLEKEMRYLNEAEYTKKIISIKTAINLLIKYAPKTDNPGHSLKLISELENNVIRMTQKMNETMTNNRHRSAMPINSMKTQLMNEQDVLCDELIISLHELKTVSINIREEVKAQIEIITDTENEVDTTKNKLDNVTKHANKLSREVASNPWYRLIIILIIILVILCVVVIVII